MPKVRWGHPEDADISMTKADLLNVAAIALSVIEFGAMFIDPRAAVVLDEEALALWEDATLIRADAALDRARIRAASCPKGASDEKILYFAPGRASGYVGQSGRQSRCMNATRPASGKGALRAPRSSGVFLSSGGRDRRLPAWRPTSWYVTSGSM